LHEVGEGCVREQLGEELNSTRLSLARWTAFEGSGHSRGTYKEDLDKEETGANDDAEQEDHGFSGHYDI